jgi:phospholipid/cholesterol/gamma-HCH transport system substrate-binding protein
METKANHLLIGTFVLAITLSAFLFILWLSRVQLNSEYAYYDVKYSDGVSGLPLGGEVRYNGVKVGTVDSIRFDPVEPSTVFVTIKVESRNDFKIRQDSEVNLGLAGITGITFVQISGGSIKSPPLPVVPDKHGKLPVIIAKPSAIKQIFEDAPALVSDARRVINQLGVLLGPENQANTAKALASIERLSSNLADASVDIKKASKGAPELVGEIRTTAKSITDLANQTNAVIAENRGAISEFSGQGLAQISAFVAEAHQLAAALDRIATRLESDPSGFLLNGRAQGKEVAVPK